MSTAPTFGTDEILWYDNGKWGQAGYALANPNGKTWTVNSASEAALFLEGFNGAMIDNSAMIDKDAMIDDSSTVAPQSIWAVAVPVTIRYDGDARPGERVDGFRFELEA